MNFAKLSWKFIKWKIRRTGMKERLLNFDGFDVQYYDNELSKPTILLLNGFGASTEFQWYKLLPALVKKNRVVMINLLHFGETKPNVKENCKIADQIHLVYTLLERLEIEECRLAGISYGGLIASEFTEKYGHRVSELILLNTPTKFLDVEKLQNICKNNGAETVHDFFAPKSYLGLKMQFKLAYYSSPILPNFIIKSFYDDLCKPYRTAWILILDDLLSEYDNLRLKEYQYTGQTKLIWGENDTIIPIEVGLKLSKEYSNVALERISKCGHLPSIEKPRRVIKILEKQDL